MIRNDTINTTSLPGNPNCTNQSDAIEEFTIKQSIIIAELVISPIVLIIVLFGDILLIAAITRMRRVWTQINMMIINLAICDMMNVLVSVVFGSLRLVNASSYQFGPIGCKVIGPFTTYANNASIFTLVLITIERFTAITFRFTLTERKVAWMIVVTHVLAVCSIIPYSHTLTYEVDDYGALCYEFWSSTSGKTYTIILFLLQYGFPLPTMIVLYSLSWRKIRKQNKRVIDMSEDFESKMERDYELQVSTSFEPIKQTSLLDLLSAEQDLLNYSPRMKNRYLSPNGPVLKQSSSPDLYVETLHRDISNTSLPVPLCNNNYSVGDKKHCEHRVTRSTTFEKLKNFKRRMSSRRKPEFKSQVSQLRYRQTMKTLYMFITVVTVFEIFTIPNQILWFIRDFHGEEPVEELPFVFSLFKYFSYMANCWIYGGFNKSFRREYMKIFVAMFKCSTKRAMLSRSSTTQLIQNGGVQEERLKCRQLRFTDMFEQHKNNFRNFEHLYDNGCETTENVTLELSVIDNECLIDSHN